LPHYHLAMALTHNKQARFYNAWVHMRAMGPATGAFNRGMHANQLLRLPIAHGEGRFQLSDDTWQQMQALGCNVFQYCDPLGKISPDFPINPNGSAYNLAAVSNSSGTIMAMMPHPERSADGDVIFQSMADYICEGRFEPIPALSFQQPVQQLINYQPPESAIELLIATLITDNHATTVENVLEQQGFNVKVKRYIHWEFHQSNPRQTDVNVQEIFYNPNKEQLIALTKDSHSLYFLVRANEDVLGPQKEHYLQQCLGRHNVHSIQNGVLWKISGLADDLKHAQEYLLKKHILFNPNAQTGYVY
jgi:hypothetical protein